MHMRMHMHMHMHIQYKQVMQMHMCARLIPQLVMRAHQGGSCLASVVYSVINSTQPIQREYFFSNFAPGTMCRVAPGARRVLVRSSSSSIDYVHASFC